jgi:hypothetical protein
MSRPYHERRTVGEVHFVCFFTGDAAARPATIAAKRILISLVMSKFFTLKDSYPQEQERMEGLRQEGNLLYHV